MMRPYRWLAFSRAALAALSEWKIAVTAFCTGAAGWYCESDVR